MTDWTRRGDCNGCGDCCQMIAFNVEFIATERLSAKYKSVRGFSTIGPPTLLTHAYAPCRHHDNSANLCRIHEDKPDECRTFPTAPDQIVHTRCSYWFERTRVDAYREVGFASILDTTIERLGGDASPYPAARPPVE